MYVYIIYYDIYIYNYTYTYIHIQHVAVHVAAIVAQDSDRLRISVFRRSGNCLTAPLAPTCQLTKGVSPTTLPLCVYTHTLHAGGLQLR